MRIPKLALLALLITAYVVWVLSLAAQLRAEAVRYEYRALPEGESKPLLIPCFVLDRFNYLCIETGDIFVQHAHQKIASDAWVDRAKNKNGERCCDAGKDCHSLNPDEVKHVPGGVTIRLGEQTLFIPGEEIMPSEDGRYWVCYWNNQVKCFFAPYSGS